MDERMFEELKEEIRVHGNIIKGITIPLIIP